MTKSLLGRPRARSSEVRRVLMVLHSIAVGGMETLCVDVAADFVKRGIGVAAVIPRDAAIDPLEERFRRAGAEVLRLDTDHVKTRWQQLKDLSTYVRFCRKWKPDVINLHTGGAAGGAAVILAGRLLTSATVVCTEHDVSSSPRPALRRLNSQSLHWFARLVLDRMCHTLVAVSRHNAVIRKAWLNPAQGRLAVVLNGVPIPETDDAVRQSDRARVRRELGIEDDTVVIGTLCRLAWNKGIDHLIRAFGLVRENAACELVLVGDGPLRDGLEELTEELGLTGRVHFEGYHAVAKPYLHAFDIFVLAVPSGSMSIALLEAMGEGLPPVITFCGPEEAVVPEETGLCAPPADAEGLAASLERLVVDANLRRRLGAAAASHVRSYYRIERVADDWLDVYQTCRSGLAPRLLPESPIYPPRRVVVRLEEERAVRA